MITFMFEQEEVKATDSHSLAERVMIDVPT